MTEYPTLMFFKSGANSSVKHRGKKDWDGLVAFVDEQMRRVPMKLEVRNEACLAEFNFCSINWW